MIPEPFITLAEAEYFCNVTAFLERGEGRTLSPREQGSLKTNYLSVQDWFQSLDRIGQSRVMQYLRAERVRCDENAKLFF